MLTSADKTGVLSGDRRFRAVPQRVVAGGMGRAMDSQRRIPYFTAGTSHDRLKGADERCRLRHGTDLPGDGFGALAERGGIEN